MNKVFIIDRYQNPGLLRFTETKLFFNAKNISTNYVNDCIIVEDEKDITDSVGIIIDSGDFLTTNFRLKNPKVTSLFDARNDPNIIKFTPDYSYNMTKRPPYESGSKQLYIIENLYKVVLKSKNLLYLDNTEDLSYPVIPDEIQHFYGLASGWKSIQLIMHYGIDRFQTITIYDINKRQLEFQQSLHEKNNLPETLNVEPPVCGQYLPGQDVRSFWQQWHNTKVNFVKINLMHETLFQQKSFIWISNVFCYEPNIFEYGWEAVKKAKNCLINLNKSCIITQ